MGDAVETESIRHFVMQRCTSDTLRRNMTALGPSNSGLGRLGDGVVLSRVETEHVPALLHMRRQWR